MTAAVVKSLAWMSNGSGMEEAGFDPRARHGDPS
jgi:hypothetical protein